MRFSARYMPAVVLAFLSLTASASAQTVTRQTNKAPRGTVSGRITIKEKPAAGVVVGMRRSDNFMPFEPYQKATTDQEGFYRITNVAAGTYEILPSAPAHVMADLKDSRSKSVIVGEDENVEGINFAMVRGGVITGRVTDADGRPVIQQQVTLYSADAFDQPQGPQAQPRQVFQTGSGQTDDRGVYRIYGLTAGRYKVASGRSEDTFSGAFMVARSTYKQVFYPDVNDPAKATVIEVKEGSEAANIDITLGRALQTFSASGRVVDGEKGQPIPNMRFGLQRNSGQRTEYVSSMGISNAQGDFVIEGLIPGNYGVYLIPGQGSEMRVEPFSFDILDQDVTGLAIRLSKGASLTGVIALETDDKAAHEKLMQLQLRAFVMTGKGGAAIGSSATSPIGPDGSFRLAGLPGGSVNLNLGAMNMPMPPKGFVISRVERDGIVQPRTVEIKDGEQLTGVRVFVSFGNATLRGVVKLENGSLPEGGRIIARLTKPGELNSNLRPVSADARGHFLIEGIPTGTYELTVSIMGGLPGPPRTVKREVSVQDGVVTDVAVTIDLAALLKP
jgi:hypothetical protein